VALSTKEAPVPVKLLAAAILLITSGASAAAETPWVPLSIDAAGAVVVPVSFNGRGPFLCLLDTGSSHSVLGQSLVDHLGLQPVARTAVLTSTGRELRAVVTLDLTTIGSARSEGLLASVVASTQLAAVARGIEGIIGQDFLFALNYTLDYRRRRLSWSDGADGGTRLPLIAQEGRYLVQIGSGSNEPPVLLVPDTGASGLVVFTRHGHTRLPVEPVAHTMAVHSLSGRQDARAMMLRELQLGELIFRDQPVAVVARDAGDAREGDGLLPLHLFDSVSFNARERHLTIRARK
jgi:predicted aspartyl protease